jgi:hypothetical protein
MINGSEVDVKIVQLIWWGTIRPVLDSGYSELGGKASEETHP